MNPRADDHVTLDPLEAIIERCGDNASRVGNRRVVAEPPSAVVRRVEHWREHIDGAGERLELLTDTTVTGDRRDEAENVRRNGAAQRM